MSDPALVSRFAAGREFLQGQGLNLCAVFDCRTLPESITAPLRAQNIPLAHYARLVLIGNAGTALWPALLRFGLFTDDPLDYYSRTRTLEFGERYLDDPAPLLLFPQAYNVPLQRLGTLAGWQQPSPLGLGIHPVYGLWFAYRAAFLSTLPLPLTCEPVRPSPCTDCRDRPCASACPAGAIGPVFDLPTCADFRLRPDSSCADRCLSRLACPVGAEFRYPVAQIRYHYAHSLKALAHYTLPN